MSEPLSLKALGEPVRKKGVQEFYNCPYHEDKNGHLGVERKKGIYHCFKCGISGKLKDLVVPLESFRDKVEESLFPKDPEEVPKEVTKIELPREFRPITDEVGLPYRYLKHRGITDEEIYEYNMGYCSTGFFAERIIIPIYQGEKLVYFLGRTYTNGNPKYLNVNAPKGGTIFKTFSGRVDQVILCEGVFDSLNIGKYFPSISILGKEINGNEQIWSIAKSAKEVFVLLDRDAYVAGFAAMSVLNVYVKAHVMLLEGAKDPGELSEQEIRKILPRKG